MRRLTLALAAAGALILAAPAQAGSIHHGQYHGAHHQHHAQPNLKRHKKGVNHRDRLRDQHALQIRRECRMYAFAYWRYHPDYKHCRDY